MFIILESTEGAGKGTLTNFLRDLSLKEKKNWVFTREPGGCPTSENIRSLLLSHDNNFDSEDELLLFAIARHRHLKETILPALSEGKVIFCERWVPTTIAYQVYGRTLEQEGSSRFDRYLEILKVTHAWFEIDKVPVDLALLLDIDPQIGLSRIVSRGAPDRFEVEKLPFFEAVRKGYHEVLLDKKHFTVNNVRLIDASQAISDVQESVLSILKEFDLL